MSTSYEVREHSPGWAYQYYRGDLLDINIWVALSLREHSHHEHASRYWQEAITYYNTENTKTPDLVAAKLHFCRHTSVSLVRILMQSTARLAQPLTLGQAWGIYEGYRALEEVGFAGEFKHGEQFDLALSSMIASQSNINAKLWMDLQLAAVAKLHGLRMVTFDPDFKRFGLADLLVLPT